MQRVLRKGADHKNYRRRLNRAYLVLTLIWIFAGLLYPLYQADELQASSEQQLKSCVRAANGDDAAMKHCSERAGDVRVVLDAKQAFEATYGEVRQWPMSIFLVCILPPLLCYSLIRFLGFLFFGSFSRAQASRKQT